MVGDRSTSGQLQTSGFPSDVIAGLMVVVCEGIGVEVDGAISILAGNVTVVSAPEVELFVNLPITTPKPSPTANIDTQTTAYITCKRFDDLVWLILTSFPSVPRE
ncbi:hypothetical protein ACF0H5_021228 [Mactra antiquata]